MAGNDENGELQVIVYRINDINCWWNDWRQTWNASETGGHLSTNWDWLLWMRNCRYCSNILNEGLTRQKMEWWPTTTQLPNRNYSFFKTRGSVYTFHNLNFKFLLMISIVHQKSNVNFYPFKYKDIIFLLKVISQLEQSLLHSIVRPFPQLIVESSSYQMSIITRRSQYLNTVVINHKTWISSLFHNQTNFFLQKFPCSGSKKFSRNKFPNFMLNNNNIDIKQIPAREPRFPACIARACKTCQQIFINRKITTRLPSPGVNLHPTGQLAGKPTSRYNLLFININSIHTSAVGAIYDAAVDAALNVG